MAGSGSSGVSGVARESGSSLKRLIRNLRGPHGEALSFVYEAGPCGYGVYREITETGHDCQVVAPSLIPYVDAPLVGKPDV